MVIKNTTKFEKKMIAGVVHASNFDNDKYKSFKMIYNGAGLLTGIMFVREMAMQLWDGSANMGFLVLFGLATAIFLYIGMYGMDRAGIKEFSKIYQGMLGHSFSFEIHSEDIKVICDDGEEEVISWENISVWKEDIDYFYLFVEEKADETVDESTSEAGKADAKPAEAMKAKECLVLSKAGFTECEAKDLKELCQAIFAFRENELAEGRSKK